MSSVVVSSRRRRFPACLLLLFSEPWLWCTETPTASGRRNSIRCSVRRCKMLSVEPAVHPEGRAVLLEQRGERLRIEAVKELALLKEKKRSGRRGGIGGGGVTHAATRWHRCWRPSLCAASCFDSSLMFCVPTACPPITHAHTRAYAGKHARMHARTHTRTHARTQRTHARVRTHARTHAYAPTHLGVHDVRHAALAAQLDCHEARVLDRPRHEHRVGEGKHHRWLRRDTEHRVRRDLHQRARADQRPFGCPGRVHQSYLVHEVAREEGYRRQRAQAQRDGQPHRILEQLDLTRRTHRARSIATPGSSSSSHSTMAMATAAAGGGGAMPMTTAVQRSPPHLRDLAPQVGKAQMHRRR
jgi:hypothetical protein